MYLYDQYNDILNGGVTVSTGTSYFLLLLPNAERPWPWPVWQAMFLWLYGQPRGMPRALPTLNAEALQAPITEVPFDCSPDFPIPSGKLRLQDVCGVRFMAQFGRPM